MNKSFLLLLTTGVCMVSLSGCIGGGGGDGGNSPTPPSPVTGEMINGIAVPPEPNPTLNNATLAGVDSNANGVRDDVERKIATTTKEVKLFNSATNIAKEYQRLVTASSLDNNAITDIYGNINCQLKELSQELSNEDIAKLTINTSARIDAVRVAKSDYPGYFSDELKKCN